MHNANISGLSGKSNGQDADYLDYATDRRAMLIGLYLREQPGSRQRRWCRSEALSLGAAKRFLERTNHA